MKKLKWNNLLNEKCPVCGCSITYKKDTQNFECMLFDENSESIFSCDFSISPKKLKELQNKITTGKILSIFDHDNAKDWNNFKTNY